MARKWNPTNADDLVQKYLTGTSEKKLADECGVSRSAIRRVLKAVGVQPRGRSEAELTKWSVLKQDRAAVERQCRKAWAASTGVPKSIEARTKMALTCFANASRHIGRGEDAVIAIMAGCGLNPAHQFPDGAYNIDVACAELRIAVEIKGA